MRLAPLLALVTLACADAAEEETILPPQGQASYGEDVNNIKVIPRDGLARPRLEALPYAEILFWTEQPPSGVLNVSLYSLEVVAAMQTWEDALSRAAGGTSPVRFRPGKSAAGSHIVIEFRESDHEDACDAGFSSSETLAHAFTYGNGCLAGAIHLSAEVPWVLNGVDREGTFDVRTVLIHEVGHLLGLSHVDSPGEVMHIAYSGKTNEVSNAAAQSALSARSGLVP